MPPDTPPPDTLPLDTPSSVATRPATAIDDAAVTDATEFASRLIAWQGVHGRHDLPWQHRRADPYCIWLSEIMLQQTQVSTVIPYYERFLAHLPTLSALAEAPVEEVMRLWSGLGYYARARNLHACARELLARHAGCFPADPALLATLPGIGRSTANAIAAFCFGARVPILDGNVKRVLCRFLGVSGHPGTPIVERFLWSAAAALLPETDVATYIQAQMDLGAQVCTRSSPDCENCPVASTCVARREQRVTELPTPRARRTLPERAVTVLILRNGEDVLLETRPPSGIWGGLSSLPELPPGEDAAAFCAARLGAKITRITSLAPCYHSFTHFRLVLHPLLCEAEPLIRVASGGGYAWCDAGQRREAALPAPIRRLLFDVIRCS